MRSVWAIAACLVAGCVIDGPDYPDPPPGGSNDGWGSGWGGSGGSYGYGCSSDASCGTGNVCARDGECLPASSVTTVHVMWTLRGQLASPTTCATSADLEISFYDSHGDVFGFAPVPCSAGKYTVDKMPTRFTSVNLAREGDHVGGASGTFDATGNVTLDLPY